MVRPFGYAPFDYAQGLRQKRWGKRREIVDFFGKFRSKNCWENAAILGESAIYYTSFYAMAGSGLEKVANYFLTYGLNFLHRMNLRRLF